MAGLGSSQFRESAIIRNARPEPLDERAQLTSPREWAVLACLGLVLAAIVVWGVLGTVERTLRLDGVLVLSGERRTVLSGTSGAVAEILVPVGGRAAAGQAIVRVALSDMERRVRFATLSARWLEREAKNATDAGHADAQQPPASVQAVLDELVAFRRAGDIVSPADGVIAATFIAPGQTIRAGAPVADIVSGDAGRLEAVAFAAPADSRLLVPGMAARVTVESPEGRRSLAAELIAVAPRAASPPGWLTRMHPGAATQGPGRVLRLAIPDLPGLESPARDALRGSLEDGTPCRLEIVLEHTSPLGLLIRSRRHETGERGHGPGDAG